jgi:hypothetical protein
MMASKRKQAAKKASKKAPKNTGGSAKPAREPGVQQVRIVTGPPAVKDRPDPAPADIARQVRAINGDIARNTPRDLVASGAYDVTGQRAALEAQMRQFPNAEEVPNGRYRVDGSEYILTIKGGELVTIERAHADTDPSDIIPVPTEPPR